MEEVGRPSLGQQVASFLGRLVLSSRVFPGQGPCIEVHHLMQVQGRGSEVAQFQVPEDGAVGEIKRDDLLEEYRYG